MVADFHATVHGHRLLEHAPAPDLVLLRAHIPQGRIHLTALRDTFHTVVITPHVLTQLQVHLVLLSSLQPIRTHATGAENVDTLLKIVVALVHQLRLLRAGTTPLGVILHAVATIDTTGSRRPIPGNLAPINRKRILKWSNTLLPNLSRSFRERKRGMNWASHTPEMQFAHHLVKLLSASLSQTHFSHCRCLNCRHQSPCSCSRITSDDSKASFRESPNRDSLPSHQFDSSESVQLGVSDRLPPTVPSSSVTSSISASDSSSIP